MKKIDAYSMSALAIFSITALALVYINSRYDIDIDTIITLCLVSLTLWATMISREALLEIKREKSAEIILWTEINEPNGYIYLYLENVGKRNAIDLKFDIVGETNMNNVIDLPFFKKIHGNFPPHEKFSCLIGMFYVANDGSMPEELNKTCTITATYRDCVLNEIKKSEITIDMTDYLGIKILPNT